MKKNSLRKFFLSLALVFTSVVVSQSHAFASERYYDDGLVSVDVIPNAEADSLLPDRLYDAVMFDTADVGGISVNGLSVPDSDNKWNLNTKGEYDFSVDTSGSTIYSNYVFTGHGGAVKVHLVETTTTSGQYTFKLCKRGFFNTTLYTYKFDHGVNQTINMDSFDSSDKIYFLITPNGSTKLSSSSYIKKK